MTDATADVLQTVAGPDLYRLNAFRIAGLPTTADRRAIRARRQQVVTAQSMGADVAGVPVDVDADEVKAAFDELLEDPRRRLIDELFWLWDVPGSDCSCPATLHKEHDAAAIAHGQALSQEAALVGEPSPADARDLDKLWAETSKKWDALLRRNATWDHLRHRVAKLDDRRIDESVVDSLRAGLPAALLRPLVDMAADADRPYRLSTYVRLWTGQRQLAGDLLEEAAEPLYKTVETGVSEIRGLLQEGDVEDAIRSADALAGGAVRRLRDLLPADVSRRTANACDQVAISFNNCANRLFEEAGPLHEDRFDTLLDRAKQLATLPQTRETIEANREIIHNTADNVQAGLGLIRQLADQGQRGAAHQVAARMRHELSTMPGAREEIDKVTRSIGRSPVGAGAGTGGGWSWLAYVVGVLVTCLLLSQCDDDSSSMGPATPAGTGSEAVSTWTGR